MKKFNLNYVVSSKVTQRSFWKLHLSHKNFDHGFPHNLVSLYVLTWLPKETKGRKVGGLLYGPRGNHELDFFFILGLPRTII
jgi:hypothetical protein